MAKVSVIIPVYNVEKYLRECLDSVINQTLQDIEIICINDGSADNSLEILKEYAEKDSRIIIIDKVHEGAAIARNVGIERAQGEYLAILDSDDIYNTSMLEKMLSNSVLTDSDITICRSEKLDNKTLEVIPTPNTIKTEYLPNKKVFCYKDVIGHVFDFCIGWSWDKLYKTSFIKETGLKFQNIRSSNDAYFVFLSLILAHKISCIDDVLISHRVNTNTQLSETRGKDSTCFIKAIHFIKQDLVTRGLYEEVEQSFLNWAIGFCVWHISSIEGLKNKNKIAENIEKEILNDLGILKKDKNYFYKKSDYKKIININNTSGKFNRIIKYIFSIKNEINRNKNYKVFTILGIKFKYKAQRISPSKNLKLLERIFSIKNSNDKAYKNIVLLNMSFSIRNFDTALYKYYSDARKEKLLKRWYKKVTGNELDLKNPQTFNEKIQWMKLYDSTPLKTRLADKYLVRDWVKEKIGEEYLIPLLGAWDNFDDINFDELPNQFVLKCNHGCGYNIIVKDKSALNIDEAREKINTWMKEDFAFKCGFELHYSDIPHKIIAEKYIENSNNDLYDYKVWCFNGKAHYVQFLSERNTDGLKMAFYDRDWNKQDFVYSYPMDTKENPKPKNLDLLINSAEKLSEGFNQVRVDFYITNSGQIYFGEMTFTSCSGLSDWQPKSTDLMLGKMIDLTKVK